MIGLVLVTHGRLAEELRSVMEHVVGPQMYVGTVCINVDDDIEDKRAEIRARISDVETGDGVMLLTDMLGGTPSNLAMSMLDRPGVEVIGGVNLPMLVKLAKCRSRDTLNECSDKAEFAGRKYITTATHLRAACGTRADQPVNGSHLAVVPPVVPVEPMISNVTPVLNGKKSPAGGNGGGEPRRDR